MKRKTATETRSIWYQHASNVKPVGRAIKRQSGQKHNNDKSQHHHHAGVKDLLLLLQS